MISSLISERQQRRNEVIEEISSKWAYSQTLIGPVLEISYHHYYRTTYKDDKGKMQSMAEHEIRIAYYLPEPMVRESILIK